jgi:hypothetical protein
VANADLISDRRVAGSDYDAEHETNHRGTAVSGPVRQPAHDSPSCPSHQPHAFARPSARAPLTLSANGRKTGYGQTCQANQIVPSWDRAHLR